MHYMYVKVDPYKQLYRIGTNTGIMGTRVQYTKFIFLWEASVTEGESIMLVSNTVVELSLLRFPTVLSWNEPQNA